MNRTWCDQTRFNKSRSSIPKGFRLLTETGIKEWNGDCWRYFVANEVAVLSIGKIKKLV